MIYARDVIAFKLIQYQTEPSDIYDEHCATKSTITCIAFTAHNYDVDIVSATS